MIPRSLFGFCQIAAPAADEMSRLFNHDTRCTHLGLFTFPYQNTAPESRNHPNTRRNPVAAATTTEEPDKPLQRDKKSPLSLFVNFFLSAGHFVTTFPSSP